MTSHKTRWQANIIVISVLVVILAVWWFMSANNANPLDGKTYQSGNYQIKIGINPGKPRAGVNELTLLILNNKGQAITNAKIKAIAIMPGMGDRKSVV